MATHPVCIVALFTPCRKQQDLTTRFSSGFLSDWPRVETRLRRFQGDVFHAPENSSVFTLPLPERPSRNESSATLTKYRRSNLTPRAEFQISFPVSCSSRCSSRSPCVRAIIVVIRDSSSSSSSSPPEQFYPFCW